MLLNDLFIKAYKQFVCYSNSKYRLKRKIKIFLASMNTK